MRHDSEYAKTGANFGKNCNPDGGYHDIVNANLYQGDALYFTYYSLASLEKLGYSAAMEDEILKETISNSSIQLLMERMYMLGAHAIKRDVR